MRDPKTEIVVFAGGRDGSGYGTLQADLDTYNWSINWDCLKQGRATPALSTQSLTLASVERLTCAFRATDESTGRPTVLVGTADGTAIAIIYRLRDGTYELDGSDSSTSAGILSGVLFRHDGSNADTSMNYFTRDSTAVVLQRNAAGTIADTAHTANLQSIWVVGGDLWGVDATGYQVSKLTLDADPGLTTSYGTPIPVGLPEYKIQAILPLGGSPVCCKGDGLFIYNAATGEWENLLKTLTPHKDNGIGSMTDGRGRIYYPTAEGHIVVYSFGFQSQQQPARLTDIDRDTPHGRISFMTADMDQVYGFIDPGQSAVFGLDAAALGIKVIADDGGSRTDETSDVTDGQFSTVANVVLLSSGGTDHIYIGADEPFHGVYIKIFAKRSAAGSSVLTFGYTSAANTFTSAGGSHDSTAALSKDGAIVLMNSTQGDLPNLSASPWVSTTAYAGSATKYWMRITPGSVLTGAQIAEVGIIPYRPPIDATNNPISGYKLSGSLPSVMVGRWEGQSLKWFDTWTLNSPAVEQAVVADGFCGALPSKRALYMFHQEGAHMVPVGAPSHPSRAPWPKLADYGESTVGDDNHMICCSTIDFGAEVEFDDEGLCFEFPFAQTDDDIRVYYYFGEDALNTYTDNYSVRSFAIKPKGKGKKLTVVVQYTDGSRDAVAPYFERCYVKGESWHYTGGKTTASDITSPQSR